jgi:hypothetical protein
MLRIYVTDWRDKETHGRTTPVEVFFSFQAEEAHAWHSKEQAQSLCRDFDSYEVKVDWTEDGEKYLCKDFLVEERSPGQFVLFCDGPFTFKIAA